MTRHSSKPNKLRNIRKFRKAFSKFYRRHYRFVSKFNMGLKSLLKQSLSELEFYGVFVFKFRKKNKTKKKLLYVMILLIILEKNNYSF